MPTAVQVATLETLLRGSQQENVRLLDQFRVERQRHQDALAAVAARSRTTVQDEGLRFEVDKLRREKRELQFQVRGAAVVVRACEFECGVLCAPSHACARVAQFVSFVCTWGDRSAWGLRA